MGVKIYTIQDLEGMLDISKQKLYKEIDDGMLGAIKQGNKWIIREHELKDYKELLTEKNKAKRVIKKLNRDINRKEQVLMRLEVLEKKGKMNETLESQRERFGMVVRGSTIQLKETKYRIETDYKDLPSIGIELENLLIREAEFLEETARFFREMSKGVNMKSANSTDKLQIIRQ